MLSLSMVGLFSLFEGKKNDIFHVFMYLFALMGIGFYIVGAAFPEKSKRVLLVGCPIAVSHCSSIFLPLVCLCR